MSNRDFSALYLNKKFTHQYRNSLIHQGINNSYNMSPIFQQENFTTDINEIFNKIKAESTSNVPSK